MNITVYTINDCKFSQAEKDYLNGKKIPFKEKNLESNREFLTEMLQVSNNFAGTPVTKIEKDDGETIVLKGFTAEEFDKALGTPTAPAGSGVMPPAQMTAAAVASTPPAAPIDISAPSTPDQTGMNAMQQTTTETPQPEMAAAPDLNATNPATTPNAMDMNQPTQAAPAQPVEAGVPTAQPAQAAPQNTDDGGIISLSADMPVQKETTPQPQPTVPPMSAPQPSGEPQPDMASPTPTPPPASPPTNGTGNPEDQLNSVLQNLQSQVNSGPAEEENPNQPKA